MSASVRELLAHGAELLARQSVCAEGFLQDTNWGNCIYCGEPEVLHLLRDFVVCLRASGEPQSKSGFVMEAPSAAPIKAVTTTSVTAGNDASAKLLSVPNGGDSGHSLSLSDYAAIAADPAILQTVATLRARVAELEQQQKIGCINCGEAHDGGGVGWRRYE